MKIILTFLQFRLKQLWRSIQEIGIPIIIVFLIVTLGFTFGLLQTLSEVEGGTIGLISWLLILGVHASRQDGSFLKSLNVSKPFLFLAEYNMLLLPVSVLLFFFGKYESALFWHLGTLPSIFFSSGFLKTGATSPLVALDKIPVRYFEIKTGLRRFLIGGIVIYILALGCSFFNGTLVLFTVLLLLLIPSFFEYFEPKEILSKEYEKGDFLRKKILKHIFLFQIWMLPHYILFGIYHSSMWYLGVASMVAIGLTVMFSIVYKYASYRPNIPKVVGTFLHAIFAGTILLPGFVIVSIGLIIYFWRKASKNLAYFYA